MDMMQANFSMSYTKLEEADCFFFVSVVEI